MANRLATSTSPYLRQHADNPVDWREWGEEAFADARSQDKPILLSVGYAACHWCHVMAHESFEDPETAEQMNSMFVNVKVDREERPDVDAIYMEAVQAMTGHGGWPMTVWLTPDGRPFFAGTYFPKVDRHGMPSFRRVMDAVHDAWTERRDEVGGQAERLTSVIGQGLPPGHTVPGHHALVDAYHRIEPSHDPVDGGFGGAPKFPQQPLLEFLLRVAGEPWAPNAGEMLRRTLDRMAAGGIHDQIGGGFARYAVDRTWLVPHFEKMLYDNAQLARLYLRGWQALGDEDFLTVALDTIGYMLRDLRHTEGGFFSAEDADSEGEEGKFYVWTGSEFLEASGDGGEVAADYWGVTEGGNFEGSNVLHRASTVSEVAGRHGIDPGEARDQIESARRRLFSRREQRIRPGLDDKVVAAWNGLAIRALAEAGAILKRDDLVEAARVAARFVLENLRDDRGRLLRSWSRGEKGPPGFLEDHAAMAMGLFTLYQATGESEWYEEAERLTRKIPALFADPTGGFFSTGDDAERLIKRPKDQMDNPAPSGNSLAAEALLVLSLYTGDGDLRDLAESTIKAGALLVERHPSAAGYLLAVLATVHRGTREVAVVGSDARRLAGVVWEEFRPGTVLAIDVDGTDGHPVPLLAGRGQGERTLAYVCENHVCARPVSTVEDLRAQLS